MAYKYSRPALGHGISRCEQLEPRLLLATHPLTSVPTYSSDPGAFVKFYLNFSGEFDLAWADKAPGLSPAYDVDGDATTFSDAEISNMLEISQRVAAKFAPFNIDVTTIDPGNLDNGHVLKAVIGGDGNWYSKTAGGVSKHGGFTNSESNVAFVFPLQLPDASGVPDNKSIAEAAAHEFGHTLGLNHHSSVTYLPTGTPTVAVEYDTGSGDRAPIMGNSYDAAKRGVWQNGPWSKKNILDIVLLGAGTQEDLTVITNFTNGFGYRADDRSNSFSGATAMTTITNNRQVGDGIIERQGDVDNFTFTTLGGNAGIHGIARQYSMLHLQVLVYDNVGHLLASSTSDAARQDLSLTGLAAGTYFVSIRGFSNDPASTTFDIGDYYLEVDLNQQLDNSLATAVQVIGGFGGPLVAHELRSGIVGATDPDDFFVFRTEAAPATLRAALSGLSNDADVFLIRDFNGNYQVDPGDLIASSTLGGTAVDVLTAALTPSTTYYVRIKQWSGDTNYNLDLYVDYAGGSLATARDLGDLNGKQDFAEYVDSSFDSVDLFRFNYTEQWNRFNSNPLLRIALGSLSADADLELIRDVNGNGQVDTGEVIASSYNSFSSSESISSLIFASGIYYVRVFSYGSASTRYALSLEADYAGETLRFARSFDGSVAATVTDYLGPEDDLDQYLFMGFQGRLTIDQSGPHLLTLARDLNNNGAIDSNEIVATGQNIDYNIPVDANPYFLQVSRRFIGEFRSLGNYTLSIMHNPSISGVHDIGHAIPLNSPGRTGRDIHGYVGRSLDTNKDLPEEFFSVHLSTTQYLYATLDGMEGGDADLQIVRDINGNGVLDPNDVLVASRRGGSAAEFVAKILPMGDYLFRVFADVSDGAFASNGTNYTLHVANANIGDANLDGAVDGADYSSWADNFLSSSDRLTFRQGDFNADGLVDGADYTLWADNFSPKIVVAARMGESPSIVTSVSTSPVARTVDPNPTNASYSIAWAILTAARESRATRPASIEKPNWQSRSAIEEYFYLLNVEGELLRFDMAAKKRHAATRA